MGTNCIRRMLLLGAVAMGSMMMGMTSCSDDDKEKQGGEVVAVPHRKEVIANGREKTYAVQLWKGGPYFAEFNVGATIESYGEVDATKWSNITNFSGHKVAVTLSLAQSDLFPYVGNYFSWGALSQYETKADPSSPYYNSSGYTCPFSVLPDSSDVARLVWGSNWCIPTKNQLDGLADIGNCDRWQNISSKSGTQNYKNYQFEGSSMKGMCFKGKGEYAEDSIFFPIVGYCYDDNFDGIGTIGHYWSGVPLGYNGAWSLYLSDGDADMSANIRFNGLPVRAVAK